MTKKFELGEKHTSENLFRVVALRDFSNVKKGDNGGWVASDENLSQKGNCWISGNAIVSGNARVSGNAIVSGNARVSGNAIVSGNARVFDNARVFGDAEVFGDARVFDNAEVFGDARVFGDAEVFGDARVFGDAIVYKNASVFGDARVSKGKHREQVKIFTMSKDTITIDGEYLNISVESRTVKDWLENVKEIAKKYDYSDEQIEEYHSMIKFIAKTYFKIDC